MAAELQEASVSALAEALDLSVANLSSPAAAGALDEAGEKTQLDRQAQAEEVPWAAHCIPSELPSGRVRSWDASHHMSHKVEKVPG